MADSSNKPTSPYDYPRQLLSDRTLSSEESVEDRKDDGTSEKLDINDEKSDNKKNEEEIKKSETDLTESDEKDYDENEKKDAEKRLLEEKDSVKIDIPPDNEGEDTPTLPLPDKKRKSKEALEIEDKQESRSASRKWTKIGLQDYIQTERGKLPKYLFPLSRIRNAWKDSSNVFQFVGTAVCIIFQTVGWFTCVGGIPFVSLVMLIIGSVYVHDCKIQPKIPVYLIISGLIGTIQHFIVIWTKYVPKETQGRLKVYRSYCRSINGLFHVFLLIWFILGSVWVYSVFSEVDFLSPEKDEYCNQTLYYFSFWIFNLSFILLGLLLVLSACFVLCAIATE